MALTSEVTAATGRRAWSCIKELRLGNADNLELALQLRARSKLVVSFGDCAVSANVPGLRNLWTGAAGAGTAAA